VIAGVGNYVIAGMGNYVIADTKAPTCPNATGRSCAAAVTPRQSSPSATRSCSPPTACWTPQGPTPTQP